ncbi:MAG: hypothetical protein KBG21_03755, partial [Ignavibacteria bacterium]|nr:hypothetical protein [Ignavibacteria bacterium]
MSKNSDNTENIDAQSILPALLESLSIGIGVYKYVYGKKGEIVDFEKIIVNSATAKMSGRSKEELLGKRL